MAHKKKTYSELKKKIYLIFLKVDNIIEKKIKEKSFEKLKEY